MPKDKAHNSYSGFNINIIINITPPVCKGVVSASALDLNYDAFFEKLHLVLHTLFILHSTYMA